MDCVGLDLVMCRHPVPFQVLSDVTWPLLCGSTDLAQDLCEICPLVGVSTGASAAWWRSWQCPQPDWCQSPGHSQRRSLTVPVFLLRCFVMPVFALSLMQVEFSVWRQSKYVYVCVGIYLLSMVLSKHPFIFISPW